MPDAIALGDRTRGAASQARSEASGRSDPADRPSPSFTSAQPTGQGLRLSPLLKLLKKRTVVKPAAG
jgi:hypothetical protein